VNLQKTCAFDTGTLGTGRFKDLQHLVVYAAKDVDAGKIEQLKNLLADTKSLSTPDQNQQINDLVA